MSDKIKDLVFKQKQGLNHSSEIVSKEVLIKQILRKKSNEREAKDIIILSNHIEGVNFLKSFIGTKSPDFLELCRYLEFEEHKQGHLLFKQGEIGDKFYIILNGQVSVSINQTNTKGFIEKKEIGKLSAGQSFGELALLFNSIRNASIQLDTNSSFIVLRKEIFQKYLKYKTPPNAHDILRFYEQNLFNSYQLELPEKIQILSKTELINFTSNAIIIRQGQQINHLYFIKKGLVKVNLQISNQYILIFYGHQVNKTIKFRIDPITKQFLFLDSSAPTPQEIQQNCFKEITLQIDEISMIRWISIVTKDEGNVFADFELFNEQRSEVSIMAYTSCEILQIQKEDLPILPKKMYSNLQSQIKPYPEENKLRRIYLEGLLWQKFQNKVVQGVSNENLIRKKCIFLLFYQNHPNTQRFQTQENFFSRNQLVTIPKQPHLVCFNDDSFSKDDDKIKNEDQTIDNQFFSQYNANIPLMNYHSNSSHTSIKNNMNSSKSKQSPRMNPQPISIVEFFPSSKSSLLSPQANKQVRLLKAKSKGDLPNFKQAKISEEYINFDKEMNKDDMLKEMQTLLILQLDPQNRTQKLQKKPNDKINRFKNSSMSKIPRYKSTANLQINNEQLIKSNSRKPNIPCASSTQSIYFPQKLQQKKSLHIIPYKSQRQILPKITNQIQYTANYEDIICQVAKKKDQYSKSKTFSLQNDQAFNYF